MATADEIEKFSIVHIEGELYQGPGLVTHIWEKETPEPEHDGLPKQRPDQPYPQYGIRIPGCVKTYHFNANDLPKLTVIGKARYFGQWNKPGQHGWHINPDGTFTHH